MKIFFRPIFIIFFTLLALSFSFSMRRSNWQTEKIRENLTFVQAEQKRLLLQEQELTYQEELAALPLTQEKLLRDQKWLKEVDEENLELSGLEVEERQLPDLEVKNTSAWQEWQEILWVNN